MAQLNGRVFTRLQQYEALPIDLKHDTERLEQYLTTVQGEVFDSHRTLSLKSVHGVRVRPLLEKIELWLKKHGHETLETPATGHPSTAEQFKAHVPGTKAHEAAKEPLGRQSHAQGGHTIKEHIPGTKEHEAKERAAMAQGVHGRHSDDHHSVKEHIPGTKEHEANKRVAKAQSLGSEGHGHGHHSVKEHIPGTKEHETKERTAEVDRAAARRHSEDHHAVKDHIPGTKEHSAKEHAAPTNVGNYQTAAAGTSPAAPVPIVADAAMQPHSPRTRKLLEALVLKGFVTPHKEEKPDDSTLTSTAPEDFDFKDTDLLVAVSKRITGPNMATTTVWDLVDGAVFAGMLKRKAGILEPLLHGKNEYAMVNARLKTLTLFSTDLGREPKLELLADGLKVSFDSSHYENGVKVWNDKDTEMLNAASQRESDALFQALLTVGATHDKVHTASAAPGKVVEKVKEAVSMDPYSSHSTGHQATHGHHGNQPMDPATTRQHQEPHYVKSDEQRRFDAQELPQGMDNVHLSKAQGGEHHGHKGNVDQYDKHKTDPTHAQGGSVGAETTKQQQPHQGWTANNELHATHQSAP